MTATQPNHAVTPGGSEPADELGGHRFPARLRRWRGRWDTWPGSVGPSSASAASGSMPRRSATTIDAELSGLDLTADPDDDEMREQYPAVKHPVVRTHPNTGRKLVQFNRLFVSHDRAVRQHVVGLLPDVRIMERTSIISERPAGGHPVSSTVSSSRPGVV